MNPQPNALIFKGTPLHLLPDEKESHLFFGEVPRVGEHVFFDKRRWRVIDVSWRILPTSKRSNAEVTVLPAPEVT